MANETIAILKEPPKINLKKSNQEPDLYGLHIENTNIGNIRLAFTEAAKKDDHYHYEDTIYNISNTDFWFKIDQIESVSIPNGLLKAEYKFKFGEGSSPLNIKWADGTFPYGYSDSGKLPTEMKIIKNPAWKNSYAIALGVGLFGENSNGANYIGQINLMLVSTGIKK